MERRYGFHARALSVGLTVAAAIAGTAQASPAVNSIDRDFMRWDSQIERAQQNMGDIAQRRGESNSLREFGRHLQQDHSAAYSHLREIADTIDDKSDEPLDAIHVQVEHRFETMPSDRFDMRFARHEAKDHRNFLEHFRTEAATGANRDLRDYASRQIPILEGSLKEAETLMSRDSQHR